MFADIRRFMALADVQLGALLLPGPGAAAAVVLSPQATAVCVCGNSLSPVRSASLSQQRLQQRDGEQQAEKVCRETSGWEVLSARGNSAGSPAGRARACAA